MTLKEIAKLANVSISTVSKVINQSSPQAASKEVQDRIWKIVNESGYKPNEHARQLKSMSNKSQGITQQYIACLLAKTPTDRSDTFGATLTRSIEAETLANGYCVRYTFTPKEINADLIEKLKADKINGIIVFGKAEKFVLTFLKKNFKFVVYISLNPTAISYDQVICNGCFAAQHAVQHLIDLGHTRIAYIGETKNEQRYDGYKNALDENQITHDKELIFNITSSIKEGYDSASTLFQKNTNVSAIFCINDILAIGVLKAIEDAHLSCPKDISVISIDNIELAQFVSPMLTTVDIPVEEMGKMAVKILIDRIKRGHTLPLRVTFPFKIIERESCQKYKPRS